MFSALSFSLVASSNSSLLIRLSKLTYNSEYIQFKLRNKNKGKGSLQYAKCVFYPLHDVNSMPKLNIQNPRFSDSGLNATGIAFEVGTSGVVADKLQRLVAEFKSLSKPIDRVKRLLHYAALLPRLEESVRVQENRVKGCATQVWLVSEMDEYGRMRFKADSDSEISRGFCSCLIWMLDGAEPEEVLMVEKEDLVHMNVGLHGKSQSRVNTWHNVLLSMQKATKALVVEMEGKQPLDAFSSLSCYR